MGTSLLFTARGCSRAYWRCLAPGSGRPCCAVTRLLQGLVWRLLMKSLSCYLTESPLMKMKMSDTSNSWPCVILGYLCNVALWMKRRNPLSRSCRDGGSLEPPTLTSLSSRISSKKQTETTVNSKPKKRNIHSTFPHSSPSFNPCQCLPFISSLTSRSPLTTRMVARLKGNNAVLNVKFASDFFSLHEKKHIDSVCLSNAWAVVFQVFLIFFGNMRHAGVSNCPGFLSSFGEDT
nr:PREDICTED: uncharacterized protein LOC109449632 [Rhinolophus sinicus]